MVHLVQRLFQALLTILVAVALVFLAVRVLPRNPVLARFGQHPVPDQFARIMEEQGWNDPLSRQLMTFLKALSRGDLGNSFMRGNERIGAELWRRVPATIELSLAAIGLALPLGVLAGVASASWRNGWPDRCCMLFSLLGVSVPVFFLGICLIQLVPGLPTGNRLPPGTDPQWITGFALVDPLLRGRWDVWRSAIRHLTLPAIALSTIPMAIVARVTRSSMLDVLDADYVRTSRAKGAGSWRTVWCHAFPNAAIPVSNIAGFQIGSLLTGAVLTETVFSWPGLGRYLMEGVQNSDYAVVQGGALFVAAMFVVVNLLLDLWFMWLDPRLRQEPS